MEFYYIVEKMPIPEIKINELEKAIEKKVRISDQEKTLTGNMYFQCLVNCKGKAWDFQVIAPLI